MAAGDPITPPIRNSGNGGKKSTGGRYATPSTPKRIGPTGKKSKIPRGR